MRLGQLLVEDEDWAGALALLGDEGDVRIGHFWAELLRADALRARGQDARADDAIERAWKAMPDACDVQREAARLLQKRGDHKGLRDTAERVARCDAFSPLLAQVAAGYPVLLRYQEGSAWWSETRYAVLIGYDRYKQRVLLRSGMHRRQLMAFDDFESAWAKEGSWAVLLQSPRQLPAEVDRQRWLRAADELARSGQEIAARQAVASLGQ